MKLLITNAVVCDPQSTFHGKKVDVFIANGIIESIQTSSKKPLVAKAAKTIDAAGATLSPGLVDMRAALREPGFEYKEDLQSAAHAAAAGGYTTITALPNTSPVMQTKSDMEFVKQRATSLPVHILPYGALTKNAEGTEMNELFDMHQAGAVAFTDGNKPTMHAGVMMRSLMYSKIFGGLVLSHAEDTNLSAGGRMHEGVVSVNLGLKGIPNMAEDIMVVRDIELARYTQAPIHFSHISSKGSVELIRKAKKQGVQVTCDVAVANLVYTDEALTGFDSNFKLNPPLRGKADQKALWDGLADGTIDCIVTDHTPEDIEHKVVEFEYAAKGMIMFQTALSLLLQHKPNNVSKEVILTALTQHPRRILKQPAVAIQQGAPAELCLYNEKQSWEFTPQTNRSKSANSPVLNQTLRTKVVATINKNKIYTY
jgi:dihydroorotase